MERDAFHVAYLSDKIPEALFHGHAVKTVAYLRVSTAQQDLRSQRRDCEKHANTRDRRGAGHLAEIQEFVAPLLEAARTNGPLYPYAQIRIRSTSPRET